MNIVPLADKAISRRAGGSLHFQKCRPRHQREDAHFQAVEHPAEKGREENEISPDRRDCHGGRHRSGTGDDWALRTISHGRREIRGTDQSVRPDAVCVVPLMRTKSYCGGSEHCSR